MTEAMLLAIPDYKELSDPELARAVTIAKQKGRQTAELIAAKAAECFDPGLLNQIATYELYLNHCVTIHGADPDLVNDWGMKNAVEACDDPRLYWFCVIYQRTVWKLRGNVQQRKPTLAELVKIRNQQWEKVTVSQYQYSMQVAAIHNSGGNVQEPGNREALRRLHQRFNAHLNYAMLAVMTLNVAMEEWMERANHEANTRGVP